VIDERQHQASRRVHASAKSSTATLDLGGDSRKQRIDFHIIQPLQCSGQVLRQEMALP
jgi:hypothetical protein